MRHSSYGPRKKRNVEAPPPIDTKALGVTLRDWQRVVRNAMGLALNGPRDIIAVTSIGGGYDGSDTRAGSI